MKKIILSSIIALLFVPSVLNATTTQSWVSSSTPPQSFISPNKINAIDPALKVFGTATSTINKLEVGNLNVTTGATMPAAISLSGFTQGSTLFVGPSGTIAQDNANYFWDDANNRLGIGTVNPGSNLEVSGSSGQVAIFKSSATAGAYLTFNESASVRGYVGGGAGILTGGLTSSFGVRAQGAFHVGTNGDNIRLTVDTSGNVGIGTVAPGYKLGVRGTAGLTSSIHSFATGVGGVLIGYGGNDIQGRTSSDTSGDLLLNRYGGNVGIGNTTPLRKLEIATTTASATIGGGEMLRIEGDPNGNLIGTVSEIGFGYPASVGNADVLIGAVKTSASGFGHSAFTISTRSAAANILPVERMRVSAVTGNVGIGTANPGAKLHVETSATGANTYFQTSADGGQRLTVGIDTTNKYLYFDPSDSTPSYDITFFKDGATPMVLFDQSTGNVGIGTTTPAAKLSVVNVAAGATGAIYPTNSVAQFEYGGGNGVISLAGNSSSDMGYVFSSPSGAYDGVVGYNTGTRSMNLNTAGSERVRITSSGNVGIGTTTPFSKFHVTAGASATTTSSFASIGLTSSKSCFNVNQADGSAASFYFVGGAMIIETNYCK